MTSVSVETGGESHYSPSLAKILAKIILDIIKGALDAGLCDEQAVFWKEWSCTDQIAMLRIIIEQTLEWNTGVYILFIDFAKAFDSVDQEALWKILRSYGIPEKSNGPDQEVERVREFIYLHSVASTTGGTEEDTAARIRKSNQAFAILKAKLRIFNTKMKSVLLYGSETWWMTRSLGNKIQAPVNRKLR